MSKRKRRPRITKVWLTKKQALDAVNRMPIRHRDLGPDGEAFCRYTYLRAGKCVQPTLEQWELGFMRERNPARELAFWIRVAIVLEKLQPKDPRHMIALICRDEWTADIRVAWQSIGPQEIQEAVLTALEENGGQA